MSFLTRLRQLFEPEKTEERTTVAGSTQAGIETPTLLETGRGTMREAADFEELEELLIDAGIDVETTMTILHDVRKGTIGRPTVDQVVSRVRAQLAVTLDLDSTLHVDGSPAVILVTGVNGVGKTSSIAKLANMLKGRDMTVLLIAADTFRAGAIDQLAVLGDRIGVPVMRSVEGQDPSSVVFNGLQKAIADNVDVVIVDTAGRMENKKNLTAELQKILRTIATKFGRSPSEVLLVIDATTGENALMQARAFSDAVPVSGIILTKVDSGARGGSIIGIARELRIPIKLVCDGETMTSIKLFDKDDVVNMILLSE